MSAPGRATDRIDGGQPVLPMMAVLPDGRFALRIGLREGGSVRTWQVSRYQDTPTEESPVSGWRFDCFMSDMELAAVDGHEVTALVDTAAVADELEEAGQFVAARLVRKRTEHRRVEAGLPPPRAR